MIWDIRTTRQGAFEIRPLVKTFNAPLDLLSIAFSRVTPSRYAGRGKIGVFRAIDIGNVAGVDPFRKVRRNGSNMKRCHKSTLNGIENSLKTRTTLRLGSRFEHNLEHKIAKCRLNATKYLARWERQPGVLSKNPSILTQGQESGIGGPYLWQLTMFFPASLTWPCEETWTMTSLSKPNTNFSIRHSKMP